MSVADFFITYGPGLGGLSFVVAFGALFWWADRCRDRRRAVAEVADVAIAACEFKALADALEVGQLDLTADDFKGRRRLIGRRRVLARNAAPG